VEVLFYPVLTVYEKIKKVFEDPLLSAVFLFFLHEQRVYKDDYGGLVE
jgi:hypothetical protein